MKALIVDDSRTMRTLLGSFARALSFETVEAMNGRHALEQIARHQPFDVALLDWDMPEMNGIDLLKVLRANHSYDHMKIMMVTAQSGFDSLSEAVEQGANDYLMKPLTEEMFNEKMRILGLAA